MKHRSGIAVVLLALILVFSAAGAYEVGAEATLAARWGLNNDFNDSVGVAHGTAHNGPVFNSSAKAEGSHSLDLNGSNQYVSFIYTLSSEYTISLWIKPDAVASRNVLVYTDNSGPTTNWSNQIRITSDGRAEHYLSDGVNPTKIVTGTTPLRVGTWNFLTISAKNNGQMKLYVNGYPEGTPVSFGTSWAGGVGFLLGSNSGGGMGYYDGLVDDVRLYNAQMSDTEVQALYHSYGSAVTYYVKSDGTGDCTSWVSACTLQTALGNSLPGDQIWVAAGVYKPTTSTGDRTATFQLKNGVAVYGGFPAAGSPIFEDRDWDLEANATILSGDIDNNDDNTDGNFIAGSYGDIVGNNSYHVVTGATGATLDGFIITAGYAGGTSGCPSDGCGGGMYNNNSSPTIANVYFSGNYANVAGGGMNNVSSSPTLTNVTFCDNAAQWGGGMNNVSGSNPALTNVIFCYNTAFDSGGGMSSNGSSSQLTLTNVTFSYNYADWGHGGGVQNYQASPTFINVTFDHNTARWGGGMHTYQGSPTFTNVTFGSNSATGNGGGMGNEQSSPTLTNVTISGNSAPDGGGMHNYTSSNPQIRNTILWGNTAATNPQIASDSSSNPVVGYSVVQGGYGGTGNLSTDPKLGTLGSYGGFAQTIPLQSGSSAINTGNAAYCTIGTDQRGTIYIGTCDIGAFEYEGYFGVYYSKPTASGSGSCLNWLNACTLQKALSLAASGDEIWVAAGVHKPTTGTTDRVATFQLKNGVAVYGGFAGTETARAQRNPTTNVTILSGDIDNNDVNTDGNSIAETYLDIVGNNSYHVVIGTTNASMDGFIITAGKADGAAPYDQGGGMNNNGSSPTVANVYFSGNSANIAGGGMANISSSSPAVTNVTFSSNSATWGGGMNNLSGSNPALTNVTFSNNRASDNGGGMNNDGSSPTLTNVTFSGNSGSNGAGGIYNYSGSNPQIRNTILWGNNPMQIVNNAGSPTVTYSVVQGGYGGTGNLSTDPRLGTLGSYGGFTPTLPLLPGSSAITTGNDSICAASVGSPNFGAGGLDQRGIIRPQGTHCDIGAFESQGFTFTNLTGTPQSAHMNAAFATSLGLTVSANGAGEPVDGGVVTFTAPASGATITVPSFTLTITGGAVSQTVTANNSAGGPYNVTASAAGATSVNFALTNIYVPVLFAIPGGLTGGSCDSWANACELRYALTLSLSGQEIWAAAGMYKSTAGTTDRDATFQLKDGVAIYGGFPATGNPVFADRDPATYLTILSGDIDNNDVNTDGNHTAETSADIVGNNSIHVVTGANGATLDGFTVTAGKAEGAGSHEQGGGMYNNYSSPTLTNVTFRGNVSIDGGGMYNSNSSPTLMNVTFSNNSAKYGGGMYNYQSSPVLTYVIFSSNESGSSGGGMKNYKSSPTVTNATFDGNHPDGISSSEGTSVLTNVTVTNTWADYQLGLPQNGDGIYDDNGTSVLTNVTVSGNGCRGIRAKNGKYTLYHVTIVNNQCGGISNEINGWLDVFGGFYTTIHNSIIWGNTSPAWWLGLEQIDGDIGITTTVVNSVEQGGCNLWISNCTHVITTDPLLGVLGDNGGFTPTIPLLPGSSAFNVTNANCASTDQRGVTRSAYCDAGAFEYDDQGAYFVKPTASGSANCESWANACTLQTALHASYGKIWVMQGTYKPGTAQTDTFQLPGNVIVYGGFAGTETDRDQRDPATNITILSGDIDDNDVNTDGNYIAETTADIVGNNSIHVVTGTGGATLDGFIITAGDSSNVGGGMYNNSANPLLLNVTFSGNRAYNNGGGMYNNNSSPAVINVTFRGNATYNAGGGMYNNNSSPTVQYVTFSGNAAVHEGGGMYNSSSNPTLANVTFSGNAALYDGGGGMYNNNSSPTLTNMTFSGNSAPHGSGVYNYYHSSPMITNVTFNANSVTSDGSGIYNYFYSNPTVRNSILWGNWPSSASLIFNDYSSAPVVSDSVIQGGYVDGTNIVTADPLLGTLGNYGGITQTIPLLPGSPAIDATGLNCPGSDQRGVTRPQGSQCDIGAVEMNPDTYHILSGNAGIAGATIHYAQATTTADSSGNYSFSVYDRWSGTVTVAHPDYTFTPVSRTYTNLTEDMENQGYTATHNPYTLSGNAGVAGATITYTGGSTTAVGSGAYSFSIPSGWSGTVTPSLAGYIFTPSDRTYTNLTANTAEEDYTATPTYAISGNAVVAGATITYDGGSTTADASGNYSFSVLPAWSGTVTPSRSGYTFAPPSQAYTNVTADMPDQDYSATAIEYTLTTNTVGSGTVSADPSSPYHYGDVVQLTASAAAGWTFAGWSGACLGTEACAVVMDADKSVTATFTQDEYTLTVTSAHGTVVKTPDQATYHYGDVVLLNVTPDDGWSFTDWTGDLTGSDNPASVTIHGNTSITAGYTAYEYTLTVASARGTVAKYPDQATYHYGDVVVLNATPDAGWGFVNWTGDLTSSDNPDAVTIHGDTSVTANYTDEHTLTVTSDHGTVTKAPDQAIYYDGDVVQLSVAPDNGWSFANWTGDLTGGDNPASVTILGDTSVTANYTQNEYTLDITTAHGTVTKVPDQATYHYGDVVQLTLVNDPGWSFSSWSGDLTGSDNPASVTIHGNTSVTANYTQNHYTMTITSAHGTVTPDNPGPYHYNDVVQLTAAAEAGWTFSGWTDGLTGADNPASVTIQGNTSVTANYTQNHYTLTVASPHGTVTPDNPGPYHYGDVVQLTLVNDPGWSFASWSGGLTGSDNPASVTIHGNTSITANYTQNEYTLTVVSAHGIVTPDNPGPYHYGDVVQLTLVNDPGWSFANWSGDLTGSDNPASVTIHGNTSITASYTQNEYTLTIVSAHGIVTPDNPGPYHYDDVVQLTVVSEAGWSFANWTGDLTGSDNPGSVTIHGNTSVTANYTQNHYTLTVASAHGTVTKTPDQATYHYDDVVQLSLTSEAGWSFASWSGDLTGSDNPASVTIHGNTSITANYVQNEYTLTVASAHGTVTKTPDQATYHYGDVVQLTAAAYAGYIFAGWSGDVTGMSNPIDVIIHGDTTATANYGIAGYTLTVIKTGTGSGTVTSDPPGIDCGENCSIFYGYGANVTLTAKAAVGSSFTGWSGGGCSGTGTCTVELYADTTVTAHFETYRLFLPIIVKPPPPPLGFGISRLLMA